MITPIEYLSIFDLMSNYCVLNNKYLLYFNNEYWSTFDDDKKQEILDFYADYAPDVILEEMKYGRNCVIEYSNDDVAILNAAQWFPPKSLCPSPEYFFRCLVMDNKTDLIFENINSRLTETEE